MSKSSSTSLTSIQFERSGPQIWLGARKHLHRKKTRLLPTLWMVKLGNSVLASSFVTPGCTITSSPLFQLTGVVMRCLSPS